MSNADAGGFTLQPIGMIHSCFPEKFGIPRQPLLAPTATARLQLLPPYNDPDCVAGLEAASHLWLTFIFHQHLHHAWKPKVRPPRLGGNKKLGVFASRSSFRPNHLGMSVVRLDGIDTDGDQLQLHLSGVDLLDGTPVVDIKPYLPYADAIAEAEYPLAELPPKQLPVIFSEAATQFCRDYPDNNLQQLLTEILQQDPRPAYQALADEHVYKMAVLNLDVHWCCREQRIIEVIGIELRTDKH